jgi:hypothetical protein
MTSFSVKKVIRVFLFQVKKTFNITSMKQIFSKLENLNGLKTIVAW